MKRFVRDIIKYRKFIVYFGKAELKSRVAESYLGYLWWILDPLLFMLVYSFVSIYAFGKSEKYFSTFIFIGYTTFKYFESGLTSSVRLVKSNKSIISKVYIPKHVLLLGNTYVFTFTSCISYFLVFGTMILYRVPVTWCCFYIIPLWILLFLITFSFSTFLMHFGVFVDDLNNVIRVALRLMFYLSGVFYSLRTRRMSKILSIVLLKYNPMAFIIDQMRGTLLYGEVLDYKFFLVWLFLSLLMAKIGIKLIYNNENSYVKAI